MRPTGCHFCSASCCRVFEWTLIELRWCYTGRFAATIFSGTQRYNAGTRLDYCSIVWGNCGKTLSERLQKLQNRAARILTSSSYDADARYLLQQLGWKDLITQRQIQVALMVFKALNDLAPDYLSSMFTERSTSGYVLRDSTNKLNVPLPRTNYLKRSFSYRGATLWNSLPCNLRQEKSLNRFKQLLNFHFS